MLCSQKTVPNPNPAKTLRLSTSLRVYSAEPIAIFASEYPDGLTNTALCRSNAGACTSDPMFRFPSVDATQGIYSKGAGGLALSQEPKIEYVAYTRAKELLAFLVEFSNGEDDDMETKYFGHSSN